MTENSEDYITDYDFYMSLASISAKRSKDPNTKVGSCIVDDEDKIVGLGYNGMPNGCSDNELPWEREGEQLDTKYPYVCHAELNAVMNCNNTKTEGSTLFTTMFPCNECAKLIIQAGIKEVIFLNDKYPTAPNFVAAKRLFNLAKVTYRKCMPQLKFGLFTFKVGKPFEIRQNYIANTNEKSYISWEEYFMAVSCLAAARSRNQSSQVGACIVNKKNRIVSIGYNELQSSYEFDRKDSEKSNQPLLCNAIIKAISMRSASSLVGCTIFTTMFPCSNCAKIIVQHSIYEVVYLSDDFSSNTNEIAIAKERLDFASVRYRQFNTPENVISIKLYEDDS